MGVSIDVGEFPPYVPDDGTINTDPERPVRLVARAVARGADRIGPLRKLSRHLEGVESKAGLASDLMAAAFDLYGRNSEQIDKLITEYMRNVQAKSSNRRNKAGGGVRSVPFGQSQQTQQEA